MPFRGVRVGWYWRSVLALCCAAFATMTVVLAGAVEAGAASPAVTMSASGALHDGETITVKVGPNSVFTPYAKVNILECADPGGTVANLPVDDTTCDGNTIQSDTIPVAQNGSFSETDYTIYQLPSLTLGEQSNYKPICNQTNICVLYVGQDENNFSAPKSFSAPFTVGAAAAPRRRPPPRRRLPLQGQRLLRPRRRRPPTRVPTRSARPAYH